jgi:hypothetical protein
MWMRQYSLFLRIVKEIDERDKGPGFGGQRDSVNQFYEVCNAAPNFEAYCTRQNFKMLCDFMKRVSGGGYVREFPEWTFIIS